MSLLSLPSELLQQIISYLVLNQNFPATRRVHSKFNDEIVDGAGRLLEILCFQSAFPEHAVSLLKYSLHLHLVSTAVRLPDATMQLLCLHFDLQKCLTWTDQMTAVQERSLGLSRPGNSPTIKPGSVESLLLLFAFHRALHVPESQTEGGRLSETEVFSQASSNDHIITSKLTVSFLTFVSQKLTLIDIESLISIAELVSTMLTESTSTEPLFSEGDVSFFQDRQIGKALLTEHILWNGPRLLGLLLESPLINSTTTEDKVKKDSTGHQLNYAWHGSRSDAMRITANGLAKFLWRERSRKIALQQKTDRESGNGSKGWMVLHFDPGVWRGSAGDM